MQSAYYNIRSRTTDDGVRSKREHDPVLGSFSKIKPVYRSVPAYRATRDRYSSARLRSGSATERVWAIRVYKRRRLVVVRIYFGYVCKRDYYVNDLYIKILKKNKSRTIHVRTLLHLVFTEQKNNVNNVEMSFKITYIILSNGFGPQYNST